jgi:hypothetical protein
MAEWTNAAIALVTLLVSVIGSVIYASSRFARFEVHQQHHAERLKAVEDKLGTVWEFLLRRGMAEAVQKGLGTLQSPFVANTESRSWFSPLAVELQATYRAKWTQLNSHDLSLEIERTFGELIVREVCIPHGLAGGECLLIAMDVAREAA